MRRLRSTILLCIGLGVLLVGIGVLQYHLLSYITYSEGEKARRRVNEQTEHFATDFNREIQNVYINFQADPSVWRDKKWIAFAERYEFWRSRSQYPELVASVYFFENNRATGGLKYDAEVRTFVESSLPTDIEAVKSKLASGVPPNSVDSEYLTLYIPLAGSDKRIDEIVIGTHPETPHFKFPESFGYLAVRLDEKTIKDQLLPSLASKYFGDSDFRVAVLDAAGNAEFGSPISDERDAVTGLFDLASGNLMMFGSDTLPRMAGDSTRTVVLSSRVENRTVTSASSGDGENMVRVEVKHDGIPPKTMIASSGTPAPWTLAVQHVDGSLDRHIAYTWWRNLSLGFGLLLLLAASVAAIIVSALRVKAFARRQVDFVSSVSHEFRTPLAVIYSAGENLADGVTKENEQVSRYGELIKGEGRKLSGMVEQILDFAGASSGRKKYNFKSLSVDEIVRDAVAECRPLLNAKNVEIDTSVAASLPNISADKPALSGAIQNLIANSVKYGNGSNRIKVVAENGRSTVKITVEDGGIGISRSDLKRVFEPFYRSREVVDAQIHGNGLGLSIVRQVAEAHGGKVFATSEVGVGSKFTVELPFDAEARTK